MSHLSLARTDKGVVPEQRPVIELPVHGPCEDRVYSSGVGAVRRLRFPVEIEGNPLFWERPAERAGASNPEWITLSSHPGVGAGEAGDPTSARRAREAS